MGDWWLIYKTKFINENIFASRMCFLQNIEHIESHPDPFAACKQLTVVDWREVARYSQIRISIAVHLF